MFPMADGMVPLKELYPKSRWYNVGAVTSSTGKLPENELPNAMRNLRFVIWLSHAGKVPESLLELMSMK
jgi:hypothetical protein